MELVINKMHLVNFQKFNDFEIDFPNHITNIYGRNQSGKTTLSNAFAWLLFGKSADGRTKFSIKTQDENGNDIKNLPHYVEAELSFDGEIHTLKRALVEKWSKVRGVDAETLSNTTEYYIDGSICSTAAEYNSFIEEHIPEAIFKSITNPTFFLSQKWETQRAFLVSLVGGVTNEEVAEGNPTYVDLLTKLSTQTLDSYKKSLRYQIKQLKDKLDLKPAEIKTLNEVLPENVDYTELENKEKALCTAIDEIKKDIDNIKLGGADDVARKNIKAKLDFVHKRINNIEISKRNQASEEANNYNTAISQQQLAKSSAENLVISLEAKQKSLETLIKRTNAAIDGYKLDIKDIEKEWEENKNSVPQFPEDINICPTCGQMLPMEVYKEKREELINNFNQNKVKRANEIKAKNKEIKANIKEANDTLVSYQNELNDVTQKIIDAKVKAGKQNVVDLQKPKTAAELLQEDENYNQLLKERDELQAQYDTPVATEDTTELENSLQEKEKELAEVRNTLATKAQRETILNKIEAVKKEQLELQNKITEKEKEDDVVSDFENRQNEILEDKVNAHFHFGKWKMFRSLLNGGRELSCEYYVNGIAYHDTLNSAAKINGGIDIINVLSEHYKAHAPIFIDNAEGVNDDNWIDCPSQQVRLYVSNDEKFVIK